MLKKQTDNVLKTITPAEKAKLTELCKANLETTQMRECQKGIGRRPLSIDDCVVDLSLMKDERTQKAFMKALVAKFVSECPNHQRIKFHHKVKKSQKPKHGKWKQEKVKEFNNKRA